MVLWRLQGNLAGPSANCRFSDYYCGQRSGTPIRRQGIQQPNVNLLMFGALQSTDEYVAAMKAASGKIRDSGMSE
jgi:hypothetical protein